MINQYQGRPVGVETIATSLGEEVDTIEDVYEPYLIQIGYISRTPRGRMVMHVLLFLMLYFHLLILQHNLLLFLVIYLQF